jgi:hypothetical protein
MLYFMNKIFEIRLQKRNIMKFHKFTYDYIVGKTSIMRDKLESKGRKLLSLLSLYYVINIGVKKITNLKKSELKLYPTKNISYL